MNYTELLPSEFQRRMQALLGDEYPAFLASYEKPRRPSLRINPLKLTSEDFLHLSPWKLTPVPWAPNGFYYSEEDRPGKHPMHEAGLYYIQEASAMAVAALSGTRPGERVLDLCAAPGGKSTQLAGMLMGQGLLISNEIHPARAKILSRNIERLGIKNAVVTNETPEHLALRFPGFFDRIIVDAPCSGEGMFRKEEAAIPNWSIDNVRLCAARQRDILTSAFEMLKVGGTLVYSTCTFAKEENEDNIAWLTQEFPLMKPVDLPSLLGKKLEDYGLTAALDHTSLRLFPHKLDGEGHFLAVLTKGEPASETANETAAAIAEEAPKLDRKSRKAAEKAQKKRKGKTTNPAALTKQMTTLWEDFASDALNTVPDGILYPFGNELYLLPEMLHLDQLKVLRPGLHLGSVKKDRFEPDHALVLALKKEDFKRTLSVPIDSPEARAFLRGESLPCSEKGWTALLIGAYPLGWGKASGTMLKNHYPKGLRIF